MKVENLKDFKALVKACRQLGVDAIEVDGLKISLGRLPSQTPAIDTTAFPEASIKVPQFNGEISDVETPKTEGLTEEQLLFYSAQGHEEIQQ